MIKGAMLKDLPEGTVVQFPLNPILYTIVSPKGHYKDGTGKVCLRGNSGKEDWSEPTSWVAESWATFIANANRDGFDACGWVVSIPEDAPPAIDQETESMIEWLPPLTEWDR